MSYSLVGKQEGLIDQIASVGGMNDLLDFVNRFRVGALAVFLNTGETSDVQGVVAEVKRLVLYATDPSVRDTLVNLLQGLEKINGDAMIVE